MSRRKNGKGGKNPFWPMLFLLTLLVSLWFPTHSDTPAEPSLPQTAAAEPLLPSENSSEASADTSAEHPTPSDAKGRLEVHMIDVGQGDAILLLSGGEAMLVDGGSVGTSGRVIDYLKKQGVTQLSFVVASHPHEDHIGGLPAVFSEFPAARLLMPDRAELTVCFEKLLDAIDARALPLTLLEAGQQYTLGDASVTVLSPGADADFSETNDWSAVLLVRIDDQNILLMGDAEAPSEEKLISFLPEGGVDLLKVGHHGSATSSSEKFIEKASPRYAALSVGAGNGYGHPNTEVIRRLVRYGAQIWRTDESGDLVFVFEHGGVSVKSQRTEDGSWS